MSIIAPTAPKLVYKNSQRVLNLSSYLQTTSFHHIKSVMNIWKAFPPEPLTEPQRELKRRVVGLIITYLIDSTTHPRKENAKDWFATANEGVNSLMVLTNRFDLIAQQILQTIGKRLFLSESSHSAGEEGSEEFSHQVSELSLARFIFLLGHSALKILQFSETLASRAKRARQHHEEKELIRRKGPGDQMGYVTTSEDIEENILETISDTELVVK